jgi:methylase of polypeptide subunit release factors
VARRTTAFYTPEGVAEDLVKGLDLHSPAIVIDPACGDGQLLSAIARRYRNCNLTLVGVDSNSRAIAACKSRLTDCHVSSFRLFHGDFLKLAGEIVAGGTSTRYVVMNPPFVGYGHLSPSRRSRLRSRILGLAGRFNLADAFVLTALAKLKPKGMLAILPSSTKARLDANESLRGPKRWRRLPDDTFAANISTCAMIWKPPPRSTECSQNASSAVNHYKRLQDKSTRRTVVIRNGVATGADAVFLKMASVGFNLSGGVIVPCARGRDLARSSVPLDFPKIWLPTAGPVDAQSSLTRSELERLRERYCVSVRHQPQFSYHSRVPDWFLGERKLIVSEICQQLLVFDDTQGSILPLHSTLAIRTRSIQVHRKVKRILGLSETWTALKRSSERMVGGAIRLTAPSLTGVLNSAMKG